MREHIYVGGDPNFQVERRGRFGPQRKNREELLEGGNMATPGRSIIVSNGGNEETEEETRLRSPNPTKPLM